MFCLLVSVRVTPLLADRESLRLHVSYKGTVAVLIFLSGCKLPKHILPSGHHRCFRRIIKSLKRQWEWMTKGLLGETPAQNRTIATAGSGQLWLGVPGLWKTDLQIWQLLWATCSSAALTAQLCCCCFGLVWFFFSALPIVLDEQGSLNTNSKWGDTPL